ncbi:MAG: gamma carbonic anhydrase family protein [Planctomycetota bacterium]|jgi:carbonic anhydrase/acetyltransferase-like protein (isoleucine patch superfamily)
MADGTMIPENDYFVASNAVITGDVRIGADASIWYGCSVRGDEDTLTIGRGTNIQDNCVMHADPDEPQTIGEDCVVGHGALLHGAVIGDRCLIGMGAIILQRAEIGDECLIGAGTLIRAGAKIPSRSVVLGVPGKVVRQVTDEEAAGFLVDAQGYVTKAREHVEGKWRRPTE